MTKKKWLFAIVAISVLAIAFFWDGSHRRGLTKPEGIRAETRAVPEATIAEKPTEQRSEENSGNDDSKNQTNQATNEQGTTATPISDKPSDKPLSTSSDKPSETQQPQPAPTVEANPTAAPPTLSNSAVKEPIPEPQKDKYLTDPAPAGQPKPVEWQDVSVNKKKELAVTLSVTCKTILANLSKLDKNKLEVLPTDGVIYTSQKVTFYEGESVFDVLLREMKKNKIHMEFSMVPIYNSNYIEGIHNLYEFDCGELSGWMYKVNGWFPNYGSSRYVLKDGDVVDWVYTCDLGRDVGGDAAAGGGK